MTLRKALRLAEAERLDVGKLEIAVTFGTGLGLGTNLGFLVQRCPKSIRLPLDVTIKQVSAGLILALLIVWAIAPWLIKLVKRPVNQNSFTQNFRIVTFQTP